MIEVDTKVSRNIGELISKIEIKGGNELTNESDLEYERFFWLIHTVIAHQINNFFSERALRKISKENFNSNYLVKLREEELFELLKDYHKPERIMAKERAQMIREFCFVLNEHFSGKASVLLEKSNFEVDKFKENLDNFVAFSEDPLRKKSNILVQILSRLKLVEFKDIEKVEPAIDYHLIRLALRNGRVKIKNEDLRLRIIEQKPVSEAEDKLIREKVSEAFQVTAYASGKNIPELNWIEWHLARSVCVRGEPQCHLDLNPVSEFLEFKFEGKCPLFEVCERRKEYVEEPKFETSYY